MQTSIRITLAVLLSLAFAPNVMAQGEQPKPEAKPAQPQISTPNTPLQSYVIALSVKESNSGKPVAEKNYSLTVVADDPRINRRESLRDGDRIPYSGGNYHDVGTNIDYDSAYRRGDMLAIFLQVESSSLVGKPDGINLPQETRWSIAVDAGPAPRQTSGRLLLRRCP